MTKKYQRGIYIDDNGYKRHSNLVHREIAYTHIYIPNRDMYPLPFREYVIHHIDGDKRNNEIHNLMIIKQEEHEKLHGIKREVRRKKPRETYRKSHRKPHHKPSPKSDSNSYREHEKKFVISMRVKILLMIIIIFAGLIYFDYLVKSSNNSDTLNVKFDKMTCGMTYTQIEQIFGKATRISEATAYGGTINPITRFIASVRYDDKEYVLFIDSAGYKDNKIRRARLYEIKKLEESHKLNNRYTLLKINGELTPEIQKEIDKEMEKTILKRMDC